MNDSAAALGAGLEYLRSGKSSEETTPRPGWPTKTLPDLRAGKSEPHLDQLDAVLASAARQTREIAERGAEAARPELALWQLSRPGYLREIADRPVSNSLGAAVLMPVAVTWLVLGVAEVLYANRYAGQPLGERPPFFAAWMDAPVWRGPAGLSAIIVLTVALLIGLALRSGRKQSAQDAVDDTVRSWEAALHVPIEELRSLVGAQAAEHRPEAALQEAAEAMQDAAGTLAGVEPLVESMATNLTGLGSAIDRLAEATPQLAQQAAALDAVDTRLRETVEACEQLFRGATAAAAATMRAAVTEVESGLRGAAAEIGSDLRSTVHDAEARLQGVRQETVAEVQGAAADVASSVHDATEQADVRLRSAAAAAGQAMSSAGAEVGNRLTAATNTVDIRLQSVVARTESRLRDTTTEIVTRTEPITTVIRDTSGAADAVLKAAETAAAALAEVTEQLAAARTVTARAGDFQAALEEARTPFVEAAENLQKSTSDFTQTADLLHETVRGAQEVINKVGGYLLLVDGIRNDEREHSPRLDGRP